MGMGPKNIFSQNYRLLKSEIDFKTVVSREKQNNKKKNFFS